jgi:hypothetical protein
MPVHACSTQRACNMHAGSCMPVHACRSMHAGSCQLLLMRVCAPRAYCKKCRVNLGSKSSGWPNVPVLIQSCRANDPPLAREATAGSPARRAGQSKWSTPTRGPVGLKLAERVSAGSLFRVWDVFHFGP